MLVIDDETTIGDLMCEMLRVLGFEADRAATGPEGLALFEHGAYDLVVTDLMMPGMTGWEVAEAVRRRAPELGVITATASVSNLDWERARELRVTLLPKPFPLDGLRRAIEQTLGTETVAAYTGPALHSAGGGMLVSAAPVTARVPAELLGNVRAALDTVRKAATQLEGIVGAVEEMVREREALQSDHEATVRALDEVRDQYQGLMEERQGIVDALEAIVRRWQGQP